MCKSGVARHAYQLAEPTMGEGAGPYRSIQGVLFYFRHAPPAPHEEQYVENLCKDLGSYHGAELAYVFGNFVPREWAWTETDRDFACIISRYWVNFAATGDPNGPGLPEWPAFDPKTDSVLYLDKTIERGPIPNQKYYAFWDAFAAGWKGHK
jgi:para-nitrobenzyl esterase